MMEVELWGPSSVRARPTSKRSSLGGGWEIEAKSAGDASRLSFGDTSGSTLFAFEKEQTDGPYRLLLRLDYLLSDRNFTLAYELHVKPKTGLDWVAVLEELPDGKREFTLRGSLTRTTQPGVLSGTISGSLPANSRPHFLALQLSRQPASARLLRLVLRTDDLPLANALKFQRLSGDAGVGHYVQNGDRVGLAPHPLFDPTWYRAQAPHFTEPALCHYILHGDGAGLSPHPLFDPAWYRAQQPDIPRGETALAHYLRIGEAQGASPHPLFDPRWYGRTLRPTIAESLLVHYVREGDAAGLSPHPLFEPAWYRAQEPRLLPKETTLGHYLREGDSVGISPNPLFDPVWYRWLHASLPDSKNALVHLLRGGFDVDKYVEYLAHPRDGRDFAENPLLLHLARQRAQRLPELLARTSSKISGSGLAKTALPKRKDAGIVVYTCLFGRYESLKEPAFNDPSVRYVAFTDDPNLTSNGWEIHVLRDRLGNLRRTSRLPKILSHLYLPKHDFSIYIDASLQFLAENVQGMIDACLDGRDVALYRHYQRDCVYAEIDTCEALNIEHPALIRFYRDHYRSLGVAEHAGLFENTLIVRKNSAATRKLNEAWWRMYLGQRDQLSLASAILSSGAAINTIRQGRQVRNNPYVSFFKHERPSLPHTRPKLYVFIAYAPPDYERDLGRTYNDFMDLIEEDAYALFLDHDAVFASPDWFKLVQTLIQGYAGIDCLFIGRTNRVGNPYQRVGLLEEDHSMHSHETLGRCLEETQGDWAIDVSTLNSSSGTILLMSKSAWRKVPFSRGFLSVDNRIHIDFRNSRRPVLMPLGLYVYHFYRADGDSSHAVRLDEALPVRAGDLRPEAGRHRLKTFVYDYAAGLTPGHYAALLGPEDWAIFLRADAMFCDKSWYSRAYARLSELTSEDVVLFGNNLVDPTAPRTDNVLCHRDYAEVRLRTSPALSRESRIAEDDLVAFMVSSRVLTELPENAPLSAVARHLEAGASVLYRDSSTHVVCRAGTRPDGAPPDQELLAKALSEQRRVAILTLGFWPNQAGMELMIHNLATHLSAAGDLTTLFAPKPNRAFEEIPHNYLLMRFKDEAGFYRMFERQHAVLPFDVLLVQGGLRAASMALELKRRLGVAVVLRTHGEDIQVDEMTGYGYRLDPRKRAIIDENIRRVDRNIVIGEHIAPLIEQIAPQARVEIIHNGVDTERFRPCESNYLMERLQLSPEKVVLVTVGRNVKKKAFHLALESFKLVREQVPHVVLVHAGKDGGGEDLEEYAKRLGVHDAFFRLGEVNYFETPLVYASADLFVFPSKVETFGNVTIEALSSGLPCVEFDYSVNRSKITSGVNGYIVPFGDVEQFASRIIELVLDSEKRRAFSAAAREAAVSNFSWKQVTSKYRKVFREFRATSTERPEPVTGYGQPPLFD